MVSCGNYTQGKKRFFFLHISHTSPHVLEDPTVPFYSVSPHVVFLIFKNLHKSDVTTRPQLDYNSHPPRVDVTNIHWVWINFLQRMSTEDTAAPQWPLLKCFQPPATPGRPVLSGRCPPLVGVPPLSRSLSRSLSQQRTGCVSPPHPQTTGRHGSKWQRDEESVVRTGRGREGHSDRRSEGRHDVLLFKINK